jgi:hypothetical protein
MTTRHVQARRRPSANRGTPTRCVFLEKSLADEAETASVSLSELLAEAAQSLEELQALFQYTITEAARRKGVGVSTLQRMCRNHGIDRWPKQRKSTDGDRRQSAGSLGDDGTTDDEEEGGSRGGALRAESGPLHTR